METPNNPPKLADEEIDLLAEVRKLTGRECNECAACCEFLGLEAFDKPPKQKCPHQLDQARAQPEFRLGLLKGCCTIHTTKPDSCKKFACGWLAGMGRNADRPDKLGLMPVLWEEGHTLVIYETKPGAWFSEAGKLWFKNISKSRNMDVFTVTVGLCLYNSEEITPIGAYKPNQVLEKIN